MNDGNTAGQSMQSRLRGSKCDTLVAALRSLCESIERSTLQSPFIASVAWIGVLYAIVLSVYTPAYETNDDVVMSMIASGTGAGAQPDEHMVFTSFAIGLMLKQLYTHFPSLPWYGMYLLSVHFLSHVAVLYALLKWRYSRISAFCFLVLFGTVGIQLMARLQFTSTAVWSTECGIFLALNALVLRRGEPLRGGRWMLVAGFALVVLGSLVRFDSYIAAVTITVIPLSILIWHLDHSAAPASRIWRKAMVAAVLAQCVAFGMQAAHQSYYSRSPAWREYLDLNPYRVKFNDYCWTRYTEETKSVFDSVQWSKNDHDMIRMCFYDDPQIFGRPKLQAIVEGFPWSQEAISLQNLIRWWSEILRNVRLWPIWALIPLQIWMARDRRFAIRHFLIFTISLDAIICGLMLLKNPPPRVYYPLIAFQALYMLFLMRFCESPPETLKSENLIESLWQVECHRGGVFGSRSPRFVSVALVAFAILGLSVGEYKAFRDSQRAVTANRRLHADLAKIAPRETDLFVFWGCCYHYESLLPLESTRILQKLNLLTLGWPQQSPINDAVKEQFGIGDLTLALFDNPNVYFLGSGMELGHYQIYIREHYRMDLAWDRHFEGTEFKLFKPIKLDAGKKASDQPTIATSHRWHEPGR